ncbi:N-6 DNA methylase [Salinibacterium sp. TMP30]|uniref:restriction endonuclease subunit M n=1 Tax=Salinibacterium sp. TMP30 TaxID=3138237 RepID=UPI003139E6A9
MSTATPAPQAAPPVALLTCPIRGKLSAAALATDGLTPTEEARRIDFIRYLLKRGYPAANIAVETVVIKSLGESGRNKLRADVIVYDQPAINLSSSAIAERLEHVVLVAEIKRESAKQASGINNQLIPAMQVMPSTTVLGAYWDDTSQILLHKSVVRENGQESVRIGQDSLANLPAFGQKYKSKPITLSTLVPAENLVATLQAIANVLRSNGVNDEQLRYKETVKLLLARYVDEKAAKSKSPQVLDLQVFEGADPSFMTRVQAIYKQAATRYDRAKSLFKNGVGSELDEDALRGCVRAIQGIDLSSASNDVMQQVFMSFVPAVFKSSLDQYFTPITLIDSMVDMVKITANDKIADPAMGTADFLSAAMSYRVGQGDDDAFQRVYGVDKDSQAYELAIINMILNRDGQANLVREDSIENHTRWAESMNVVLCNPPFGARTVEDRQSVLKNYDLGHQWELDAGGQWKITDKILPKQQLGLLFIERCYKLLADGGRLAIILPEGYLCTASYGYVREWILSHFQIMCLVELPRRIFLKSDADLRSNILVARKLDTVGRPAVTYPIHTDLVRKVGYKLGKAFSPVPSRDPETGLERRDGDNELVLDTDFRRVRSGFDAFMAESNNATTMPDDWPGAISDDIFNTKLLDMKPRRLSVNAIANVRKVQGGDHVRLGDIAEVIDGDPAMVNMLDSPASLYRLIEGEDIRAVEGIVTPKEPQRAWLIADRKSAKVYKLQKSDIIVGLVRPGPA